jgi:hypothetical protein
VPSGTAPTWLPSRPWDTGPGRSSSRSGRASRNGAADVPEHARTHARPDVLGARHHRAGLRFRRRLPRAMGQRNHDGYNAILKPTQPTARRQEGSPETRAGTSGARHHSHHPRHLQSLSALNGRSSGRSDGRRTGVAWVECRGDIQRSYIHENVTGEQHAGPRGFSEAPLTGRACYTKFASGVFSEVVRHSESHSS